MSALSRWWRLGAIAAGLTISVLVVRGRLPTWSSVTGALAGTNLAWLVLAELLQLSAMVAAAGQQRQLLVALNVRMPVAAALSLT